jgi:hypothetical protein
MSALLADKVGHRAQANSWDTRTSITGSAPFLAESSTKALTLATMDLAVNCRLSFCLK